MRKRWKLEGGRLKVEGFSFKSEKLEAQSSKLKASRGFSLIEMVVYIGLLTLVVTFVIALLIPLSKSFATLRATQDLNSVANASLERMARDIRSANTINISGSTFATSTGALSLTSGTTTTEFYLQNGALMVRKNGSVVGSLSDRGDVTVPSLFLRRIVNGSAEGIRIELTLRSSKGVVTKTETFYTFAVPRGAYD